MPLLEAGQCQLMPGLPCFYTLEVSTRTPITVDGTFFQALIPALARNPATLQCMVQRTTAELRSPSCYWILECLFRARRGGTRMGERSGGLTVYSSTAPMNRFCCIADSFWPMHRACWGREPRHTDTVKVYLEAGVSKDLRAAGGQSCMDLTGDNPLTVRLLRHFRPPPSPASKGAKSKSQLKMEQIMARREASRRAAAAAEDAAEM